MLWALDARQRFADILIQIVQETLSEPTPELAHAELADGGLLSFVQDQSAQGGS